MSQESSRFRPSTYTHVEIAQGGYTPAQSNRPQENDVAWLLREILAGQDRQNELLEELVGHLAGAQKQRASELGQWKEANPRLARSCRSAAEALGRIQTDFLESMTREITENADVFADGEFMLNEFVDRYGPRLAHLNGLLQVLAQLSAVTGQPGNENVS